VNNIGRRWSTYEYIKYIITQAIAASLGPRYKDCGFDDAEAALQVRRVSKEMVTPHLQQSRQAVLTTQDIPQADVSLENCCAGTSLCDYWKTFRSRLNNSSI